MGGRGLEQLPARLVRQVERRHQDVQDDISRLSISGTDGKGLAVVALVQDVEQVGDEDGVAADRRCGVDGGRQLRPTDECGEVYVPCDELHRIHLVHGLLAQYQVKLLVVDGQFVDGLELGVSPVDELPDA